MTDMLDRKGSLIRARAPLRLGLAGGGTDVSPYCDEFGGAVLNVTIDRFAFASVERRTDGDVVFKAADVGVVDRANARGELPLNEGLPLHRAVYNRLVRDFHDGQPIPLTLTTHVDSPVGSGLGSSSALVVAMLECLREVVGAPLGEYDIARLAFEVERRDLGMNGGRQDQYAATFGGFNFMEFGAEDRVIVNPLRIRDSTVHELEASLVLFFTGVSRDSARIIDAQSQAVGLRGRSLAAMHELKRDAVAMKEALLFGRIGEVAALLERGWETKKQTADAVSNPEIERIYDLAKAHGALAGKVSGAGGGGFLMFLVDPERRTELVDRLREEPVGWPSSCRFSNTGVHTWRAR